jgi:hypothetical protein
MIVEENIFDEKCPLSNMASHNLSFNERHSIEKIDALLNEIT